MTTFEQLLWAFMLGVAAAACYTYYVRIILGGFVRKLFELNAFDEESAVPMEVSGRGRNLLLRRALREGSEFSRTVYQADGLYYIPEEQIEKAEHKYKSENSAILVVLVAIVAFAALALVCNYVFPELVSMAKNIF